MPSEVESVYIEMAMACVPIEPIKNHIKRELESQCPLNASKLLQIIATARRELAPDEYKRWENKIVTAIKSEG